MYVCMYVQGKVTIDENAGEVREIKVKPPPPKNEDAVGTLK